MSSLELVMNLYDRCNSPPAECSRCGASHGGTHHPLCSFGDDTPTAIPDVIVRWLLIGRINNINQLDSNDSNDSDDSDDSDDWSLYGIVDPWGQ